MPRTASSCGPGVPSYLRPTASSMAQRHPRAAKSFDADSQVTYRSSHWKETKTPIKTKKRSASLSAALCSTCMRNNSRSQKRMVQKTSPAKDVKRKQKIKGATNDVHPRAPLRQELENRPHLKCLSPRQRIQPSVASVLSFVDSAKDFIPERRRKSRLTPCPGISPEPPIKESPKPVSEPKRDVSAKTDSTPAVVLSILFRMNKPRPVVRDLFDIVVALNAKARKRKQKSKTSFQSRLLQICPALNGLLEQMGNLGLLPLLKFVEKPAFLMAFPLILLQLVLQFPSLLTTILMLTRDHWQQAFIPSDVYFAQGLLRSLLPFHSLLRSF